MENVLAEMPHSEALVRRLAKTRRAVARTDFSQMTQRELHEFIDRLQLSFARVNDELTRTYFVRELPVLRKSQSQSQAQRQSA